MPHQITNENSLRRLTELNENVGSSPLSRGILRPQIPNPQAPGIIPALAGNTRECIECMASAQDHPRSRGEYFVTSTFASPAKGSSPLSRGIPSWCPTRPRILRIIPALAGNTAPSRRIRPLSRDHPRSRGEYRHWAYLIPPPRDHPRSRGEYLDTGELPAKYIGSSPLSRGIRPRSFGRPARSRIIPALAGNTPGPHP